MPGNHLTKITCYLMAYPEQLLQQLDIKAVIFDMDGTMINNHRYHLQAWGQFLQSRGKQLTEETYKQHINGYATREAVAYLFNNTLNGATTLQYVEEKERIYRQLYRPYIQPVAGLTILLKLLHSLDVPLAVATSAIKENVDFMFEHIDIATYFKVIVHAADINKGKPDPEIYLKAASLLQVQPQHCLVFEDALAGIRSAKAAGMKVIALTTTNSREKLTGADLIIEDFTEITSAVVVNAAV